MLRSLLIPLLLVGILVGFLAAGAASAEIGAGPSGIGPRLRVPPLYDQKEMNDLRLRLALPEEEPEDDMAWLGRSTISLSGRSSMFAAPLYRPHRVELSRFDCTLKGFGAGAKMGLFAGALAKTIGMADDDWTWYLMGTGAAAGALFGGTIGSESSRWNVEYRWSPDTPSDEPAFGEPDPD